MQLQPGFNARDNAILLLYVGGADDWGPYRPIDAMVPQLKVVLGPWHEIQPRYGSLGNWIDTEGVRLWKDKYGGADAEKINGGMAHEMAASWLPYEGTTLTDTETSTLMTVSVCCDLTIDTAWAAIEGMAWRPGMLSRGEEPSAVSIQEFFSWWSTKDTAKRHTENALSMVAHHPEKSWDETHADVDRMMKLAGLMLQSHSSCRRHS